MVLSSSWGSLENSRRESAYVSHHNAAVTDILLRLRAIAAADALNASGVLGLPAPSLAGARAAVESLLFFSDAVLCALAGAPREALACSLTHRCLLQTATGCQLPD
jgi:hypothetical protein